jgi:hypothetical protein
MMICLRLTIKTLHHIMANCRKRVNRPPGLQRLVGDLTCQMSDLNLGLQTSRESDMPNVGFEPGTPKASQGSDMPKVGFEPGTPD